MCNEFNTLLKQQQQLQTAYDKALDEGDLDTIVAIEYIDIN